MVQINLSKGAMAGLIVALLLPWAVVIYLAVHMVSPPSKTTGLATLSSSSTNREEISGPWGNLDLVPITLDYPSSHAVYDFDVQPYRQWVFKDSTLESIRQLFAKDGLSEANRDALMNTAVADARFKGFVIHPPDAVVRGLPSAVRAVLYTDLAKNPENVGPSHPSMFRADTVSQWFDKSGVSDETVKKIEPLVYRRENYLLFADPQLVVPEISSRLERIKLYRALHRTATFRVQVGLNEGQTTDQILGYWGRPNRTAEIEPLLTAMTARRHGLGIIAFLPPFARDRLLTYPSPHQNDDGVGRDCIWASLNFFNEQPDDHIAVKLDRMMVQDYEPIKSPAQLGDLVLLFNGEKLVHACVYLAGDVVFTKNGVGTGDPFVLEKMDDVLGRYRCIYGDVRLGFCRHKGV